MLLLLETWNCKKRFASGAESNGRSKLAVDPKPTIAFPVVPDTRLMCVTAHRFVSLGMAILTKKTIPMKTAHLSCRASAPVVTGIV